MKPQNKIKHIPADLYGQVDYYTVVGFNPCLFRHVAHLGKLRESVFDKALLFQ